jgi:hypothetical protein
MAISRCPLLFDRCRLCRACGQGDCQNCFGSQTLARHNLLCARVQHGWRAAKGRRERETDTHERDRTISMCALCNCRIGPPASQPPAARTQPQPASCTRALVHVHTALRATRSQRAATPAHPNSSPSARLRHSHSGASPLARPRAAALAGTLREHPLKSGPHAYQQPRAHLQRMRPRPGILRRAQRNLLSPPKRATGARPTADPCHYGHIEQLWRTAVRTQAFRLQQPPSLSWTPLQPMENKGGQRGVEGAGEE